MPPRKKRKSSTHDLLSEEANLDRAFKAALQATPPPPGADMAPIRHADEHAGKSAEERYSVIRARVKKRLADRFIDDEAGKDAYINGSIHVIVGKYKIRGELLDWDHELRSIHAKLDPKTRLKMLVHMAKKLKVRV